MILAAAAAVAGVITLRQIVPRLARPRRAPGFEPLDRPAGFRSLGGSRPLTTAALATIGIGNDASGDVPDLGGGAGLCAALFGPEPMPAGTVPVAFFYDFLCPICRRMLPDLERMAADPAAGIALVFHVLTGLGPASGTAARAVLAARSLGAEAALRRRLMRAAFQPDRAYVAAVARGTGADPDRLLAAMDAPAIDAELGRGRALARAFAIPGTPALIVGRTRVIGALESVALARLVAIEAADPLPLPCS